MAQITRPQVGQNQSGAGIGIGVAASSGQGTAAIGQSMQQAADQVASAGALQMTAANNQSNDILAIDQIHQRDAAMQAEQARLALEAQAMYNKGLRAEQDAVVSNKMSDAMTQFLGHKAIREARVIDENGNPTSSTLVSDLNLIGTSLRESIANSITDPTTAAAFRSQFDDYILKQSIGAYSTANQQQVQFAQKSLDLTLNTLLKQAGQDSITQVMTYEQQAVQALDNAVASGLMTAQERDSQVESYTTALREAAIEHTVRTDRQNGALIAQTSAEELGISKEKKQYFDEMYHAALEDDERRTQRAFDMQSIDQKAEQANLYEDAVLRSSTGTLTQDEVVALKGKLSPEKYKTLENKFLEDNGRQQAELKFLNEMGDKVANGGSLNHYSDKEVSNFYEYTVRKYQDVEGRPATLQEKARLANAIGTPIETFQKEIEAKATSGNSANAAEVIQAYTYVQDTGSKALDNINRKSTSILERTKYLMTKAGYSPNKAYEMAIDEEVNANDTIRQQNRANFKKEQAFKPSQISTTILNNVASQFKQEQTTDAVYAPKTITNLTERNIDIEAQRLFVDLANENYAVYGDAESANAYAAAVMSKSHGVSKVGTTTKYMMGAPEMFFGDKLTSKEMTQQLFDDVAPALPPGADIQSVDIKQYDGTLRGYIDSSGQRVMVPNWLITYKNASGQTEVLMDSNTMRPVPWTPSVPKTEGN